MGPALDNVIHKEEVKEARDEGRAVDLLTY
jgi:hypothetical protein